MSQYDGSFPLEFQIFIEAIIVTVTPCPGVLFPRGRARWKITLDEKPLGRRMQPGMNKVLTSTFDAGIDDVVEVVKGFNRTRGSAIIQPKAALLVQQGPGTVFFSRFQRYPKEILERHRRALASQIDSVVSAQKAEPGKIRVK